jgi:cell division protein FtsQ
MFKNYIPVRDIVIMGNYHIKEEELMHLLKIKKGDRLFSVTNKELYNRLKKSPWVNDATVRKDLTGQISISIKEAIPLAILSISGANYLIDKDGKILEQIKYNSEFFLNIIKVDPDNKETYNEVIRLANLLHHGEFFTEGSVEISGNRPEDIALKVDNILIKIGTGDYERKLERLRVVKKEVESRNVKVDYIDLRFADKIIVKPLEEVKNDNTIKKDEKTKRVVKKTKALKENEKRKKKR